MIFDALFERRATVSETDPRDPVLASWFGGGSTTAGVNVTVESSMQLSAVYACVRLLSSTIGSLPLDLYKRSQDVRERAPEHPLFAVLHSRPNHWQTSLEWREMMTTHLLLRGNAYSQVVYAGNGNVTDLIPLHPDKVKPFWYEEKIYYRYSNGSEDVVLTSDEVLHVRGMSSDGLVGLSPIQYMAESVGLSLAAQRFGSKYFGNSTVIGGVLTHPKTLGDTAFTHLKQSFNEEHAGPANSSKPLILEEGMTWQSIGVPPEQAQFLETRKFQVSEIARIFGVPPHMIGDVEKSTSWGSGIEQQGIGFVTYTLRPWLVRWEQAITRDLLSDSDKVNYFPEFNVEGLLRGDTGSRSAFYREMFNIGTMSQNDIRRKENEPLIEGGDQYYVPLNMTASEESVDEERALETLHTRVFRSSMDKVITSEVKALTRAYNASDGNMEQFANRATAFLSDHRAFIHKNIKDCVVDADAFARSHNIKTIEQVLEAINTNSVEELFAYWERKRCNDIVEQYASEHLEQMKNEHRKTRI